METVLIEGQDSNGSTPTSRAPHKMECCSFVVKLDNVISL